MLKIFSKPVSQLEISIGITTFEKRFEDYFVPLLTQIRKYESHAEILVAVNGEHKTRFNETYRKQMLSFLAEQPRVFPVFFPEFRGLSKLWNTLLIHASSDKVLVLNDDIEIRDPKFMRKISDILGRNDGRSFLINESWSHFLASRDEISQLGYFDERFLGIGEEDGDMTWRYMEAYGKPPASYRLKGFKNFAEKTMPQKPQNIQCHSGSKYSLFNRRFLYEKKYTVAKQGIQGMFDHPMEMKDRGPDQYPGEKFYREHKDEL